MMKTEVDSFQAYTVQEARQRVSIWALAFVKRLNSRDCSDIAAPFSGYKQSGFDRNRPLHALDKHTELKTIWLQLSN